MSNIHWNDAWELYNGTTKKVQEEILKSFDLRKLLRSCSPEIQIEILQRAPRTIVEAHAELLNDITKRKLGLKKPVEWKWTSLT